MQRKKRTTEERFDNLEGLIEKLAAGTAIGLGSINGAMLTKIDLDAAIRGVDVRLENIQGAINHLVVAVDRVEKSVEAKFNFHEKRISRLEDKALK